MNARRPPPALLALLGALLATGGCYNLNKVDPGPRWIDDFRAATPTWNVFSPWGCGASLAPPPPPRDGGVKDGAATDGAATDGAATDGGGADAGSDAAVAPLPACPLLMPGGDSNAHDLSDTSELVFVFDVPVNAKVLGAVAQTTLEPSAAPVDFTGFRQLVFSAKLQSISPQTPLPPGTELKVLLGCSHNGTDKVATQPVPATMLTNDQTAWTGVALDLSLFHTEQLSLSQACLSEVDSISFLVPPGTTDLPNFDGTLSLDNISLQND